MSTPSSGPIADVLVRRTRWLETLRDGHPDAKAVSLLDLSDDGHTEDRIRQGYTGRAPIELLQNAHVAMADVGIEGCVQFVVTPQALLVANEGRPFDAERIKSLTRLGSSEKTKRRTHRHQIGYKGIGFTAVFEMSDRPEILSRDVGFAFDRVAATKLVEEHLGAGLDGPVPARYFPLPLEPGELGEDEERVEELFAQGAVTVIRLPLRADRPRVEVVKHIRETLVPEMLLFMPAVREFSLVADDHAVAWTRQRGGHWPNCASEVRPARRAALVAGAPRGTPGPILDGPGSERPSMERHSNPNHRGCPPLEPARAHGKSCEFAALQLLPDGRPPGPASPCTRRLLP
jgi:hypothetical protein